MNLELWKWKRFSTQLLIYLINMIVIDVGISERMNKGSSFESCYFCYHHEEDRVRSDIKWNSEKYISASLVELKIENIVCGINIELIKSMTGRKKHILFLRRIPSRYDNSSVCRIIFNRFYNISELVNSYI